MSPQTQPRVDLETWRNPGPGMVYVIRLDHRGELAQEESLRAGATLTISAEERELLQRLPARPEQDFFTNGTLVPVHLIEGSDIAIAAAANPNLMSDGDMGKLVTGKGRSKEAADQAFRDRLVAISNPTALHRMLVMAQEMDAPYSRVMAVQARLVEVEGMNLQPEPSSAERPGGGEPAPRSGMPRPVTTG